MGIYKIAADKNTKKLIMLGLGAGTGLAGLFGGSLGSIYQGIKKEKDNYELPKAVGIPALGGLLVGALGATSDNIMNNRPLLEGIGKEELNGIKRLGLVGATTGLMGYGLGKTVRSVLGGKQEPKVNRPS